MSDEIAMITIFFNKEGSQAQRRYKSGRVESIPVADAMKEFDNTQAGNEGVPGYTQFTSYRP